MPYRIEYNKEAKEYNYTNSLKNDYDITEEDISQSLYTASNVVSHLHEIQRMGIWINIITSFIVSVFLLSVGGVSVWLCYNFNQTVYIYLVVVAADLLLVIFAVVFLTTGIRAYLRNRASHEYDYLKELFRSETDLKYSKKGVKVSLKFGSEGDTEYYYVSHKAQYPFIEVSKKETEKEKTKETASLLPQQNPKKERKKSLKYDERSRSKSSSRVAMM